MAKKTTVARARLRAYVPDLDIYFDTIFEFLEADATGSALDVFGHGYTARIRASEGALLIEAVILTGSVLTVGAGTVLGIQKFLVDYPKMKAGLTVFLEDARKFGQAFQARFTADTKHLPLEELSYEAEALAPKQLLEFFDTITSIERAATLQQRQKEIENSYKIAKRLRAALSDSDKERLLSILNKEKAAHVGKYKMLLLEATGTRTSGEEVALRLLGAPKTAETGCSLTPRRRHFRHSKTINF